MAPYRYAKVLKTQVHVDEDENVLVIEVWKFKNARREVYVKS